MGQEHESLSINSGSLYMRAPTTIVGSDLRTLKDMFRQPFALNTDIRHRHNIPRKSSARERPDGEQIIAC